MARPTGGGGLARSAPDLPHLTDREQQVIMEVLHRDEQLRRQDQLRVMRLKAELQELRRKGALRPADWPSQDIGPGTRVCARCRAELGRIINRGAFCRACRLRVCKACREYSSRSQEWVCLVCHKHMEIQAASGEWMNEYIRRPSRRRDNRVYVPPADVIKRSIRRSWTISNPSPRYSALRGSPEYRPYNSLPRHRDACPMYLRDENFPPLFRRSDTLKFQDDANHLHKMPVHLQDDDKHISRQNSLINSQQFDQLETRPVSSIYREHSTLPMTRHKRQLFSSTSSEKDSIDHGTPVQQMQEHDRPQSEECVHDIRGPSPSRISHDSQELTLQLASNRTIRESSPLSRRHQSLDVMDHKIGRTIPVLQRHSTTEVDAAPSSSPQQRCFVIRQDSPVFQKRHPLMHRESLTSVLPQQHRSVMGRDYVASTLEYSGNSDSGGEIMATPPTPSRRFGGRRDDVTPPRPEGSPASVRASSGEDFDMEPSVDTVFRRVTVKKRHKETRRVLESDNTSITEELSPISVPQPPISKSASPSPIVGGVNPQKTSGSISSGDWPPHEEDIDSFVPIHLRQHSLSPLGARSESLASVYSGAEGRYGTVAVKGEVEFGLQYNYKAGALEIHVKQCRDLAPVDLKRNRSDPYVKVYLLPDKSKSGKRKTKVKKHTLNPVFDETLKFHMTLHGLETRTLWLTVWHSDMFGRNDFLGEVMMGLENKVFDDPTPQWYHLQERTEPFDDLLSYKGDIIIGLKFVPPDVTVQKKGKRSRGSLHVLVKEAKNLIAVKANGTSDPFCKSYLLPDKGRSSKQKTPVLRRSCNPVWNYTFVYEDVSLQELSERSLELTVWDHDRLASNEFLGGLRFNLGTGKHYGKPVDWMDASGKEMTLWQSMLERPNFWVEGCLTLRPSLEQHRTS